ncbi:MAG: isoprenylcysteine carboxylmethyltransferase family protein [Spirochaetota bacterium]
MSVNESPTNENKPLNGWKLWARGFLRILVIVGIMAGILFAASGRIDWLAAWLLTFLYVIFLLIVIIWGYRNAPDLLRERGRMASNVKLWDKIINAVYAILLIVLLIIAGLDAGRYGWSEMSLALQVLGALGLILSGWVIWWTMAENAYLSRWARIQEDRGQRVVTGGPYRYIRHPMYAAIILLVICIAIELGSWWALIPGGLIGGLFVLRTALEDRMLHEELAGYREYAAQVRYRLVPGIW